MRIIRKSAVSLMELMVGIALLSILLPMVLSYYSNAVLMSHSDKSRKHELRQQYYLQERLDYFIARAQSKDFHILRGGEDQVLGPNLVFNYKGEADIRPVFAGENIIARLYVDESTSQLVLVRWPKVKDLADNVSFQKEIVMNDVRGMSFRMSRQRDDRAGIEWVDEWEEASKLPLSLHVVIQNKEDQETDFLFHFSSKNQFLQFGV